MRLVDIHLVEGIERVLEEKCSGMCLDNEEERKQVARAIANYLQEVQKDDEDQS